MTITQLCFGFRNFREFDKAKLPSSVKFPGLSSIFSTFQFSGKLRVLSSFYDKRILILGLPTRTWVWLSTCTHLGEAHYAYTRLGVAQNGLLGVVLHVHAPG